MEIDPQSKPQDYEAKAERADRIRKYATKFFTREYAIMQELEELRWRNALARKESTERSDREAQHLRVTATGKPKDSRTKYLAKPQGEAVVLTIQGDETA
jgi:rRNA-processing protein FCF1